MSNRNKLTTVISLEDAKSQMGVACAHVRGLEDALSEARRQRDAAEASLKLLMQVSEEPSNDKLTVVALRERIEMYTGYLAIQFVMTDPATGENFTTHPSLKIYKTNRVQGNPGAHSALTSEELTYLYYRLADDIAQEVAELVRAREAHNTIITTILGATNDQSK